MCRSKTDPRGYYRCVPSSAFLAVISSDKNYPPSHKKYIRGTFWHNSLHIPTIDDILYVQEHLNDDDVLYKYLYRQELDKTTNKLTNQHDKLVREYSHLGNMIGSLIDSRIPHFNEKLIEIQTLVVKFNNLKGDGVIDDSLFKKVEIDITNKSLSLGWELQKSTSDVLSELNITGQKINPSHLRGPEDLKELFVESSAYFPSQWNEQLQLFKRIRLIKKEKSPSSYTPPYRGKILPHSGLFEIKKGKDGISYYPNIDESQAAEKENSLFFHSRHEVVHEMTHMFEKSSSLLKATTGSFLSKRIADKQGKLTPNNRYRSKTYTVYHDNFPNDLIGTVYGSDIKENEIMARGTESVLLGANGSLIGLPTTKTMFGYNESTVTDIIPDIEHRNLILGILAGIKMDSII